MLVLKLAPYTLLRSNKAENLGLSGEKGNLRQPMR